MLDMLPSTRKKIQEDRLQNAQLKQLLRRYHLRPTRQRLIIASCLFQGVPRHVSADILYKQIAQTGEVMSLATIYNSLRHFVEAGLIRAVATCGSRQWFSVSQHLSADFEKDCACNGAGCQCQFHFEDSQHIESLDHKGLDPSLLPAAPEGYEIARIDVAIHLIKKPATIPCHDVS